MEYSVSKLVRITEEEVKMVMKEELKVRVSCLPDKVPQTPDNVASFIGPGAKVSVVHPIILLYSIQSGIHSSLKTKKSHSWNRKQTLF